MIENLQVNKVKKTGEFSTTTKNFVQTQEYGTEIHASALTMAISFQENVITYHQLM